MRLTILLMQAGMQLHLTKLTLTMALTIWDRCGNLITSTLYLQKEENY